MSEISSASKSGNLLNRRSPGWVKELLCGQIQIFFHFVQMHIEVFFFTYSVVSFTQLFCLLHQSLPFLYTAPWMSSSCTPHPQQFFLHSHMSTSFALRCSTCSFFAPCSFSALRLVGDINSVPYSVSNIGLIVQ